MQFVLYVNICLNRLIMETIVSNSVKIEKTIETLRNEYNLLKRAYNIMRIQTLTNENKALSTKIEQARKKLVQVENANGIKQIPIPSMTFAANNEVNLEKVCEPPKVEEEVVNKEPKKEKEPKKKVEKKPEAEKAELPVDVGRLDLRVGLIKEVQKHPDADSLYVSKIECGDPSLRTVVSGLVKHVPIEELQGRKVVVLCNLKPVKMRGVNSEAMVMCASAPDKVEVLVPPPDAQPGDLVECEGFNRQPDAQLNPKKKIFESVAPDLKTNDNLQACYKGSLLKVTGKGNITAKSLKNVNIK